MSHTSRAALAAVVLALLAAPARAQQVATPTEAKAVDEKSFKVDAPGTYANADLSYVLTSGNSSSSTLGFKGDLTHRWAKHSIGFAAGGLRASSSPETRATRSAPRATSRCRSRTSEDDRRELLRARALRLQALRPASSTRRARAGSATSSPASTTAGLVDTGRRLHLPQQRQDELPQRPRDHLHERGLHGRERGRRVVRRRAAGLGLPAEDLPEHDVHPHPDRGREPRGHVRPPRRRASSACRWP